MSIYQKNKKSSHAVLMGVLALVIWFAPTQAFGFLVANFSECAFKPICGGGGGGAISTVSTGSTIDVYIEEGAGYFLKSHSEFLQFLNRYELSNLQGFTYTETQSMVDAAILSLEQARVSYINLTNAAGLTPYNDVFVQRLVGFDYTTHQQTEMLDAAVFGEVRAYLEVGDVRGIYDSLLKKVDDILKKLYNVKSEIDQQKFPSVSNLWRLNQAYCRTMTFGEYVSEVCFKLN